MAVKMRLMRMGKKKSPYYRVVVMDGRAPRDGRYIDLIGRYDPKAEPSFVEIDNDKAVDWLSKGAQPTETVAKLLEISGAMSRFKVASGKIHTVAGRTEAEPAPVAEPAEETAPVAESVAEEPAAEEPAAEEPAAEEPAAEEPATSVTSDAEGVEPSAADGEEE